MTYILAPERDEDPAGAFERYADYLGRESARFPRRALELATSDWYLGTTDHRAPHDAWLLSASFEESRREDRQQERAVALRLRLLGAYHDQELEFTTQESSPTDSRVMMFSSVTVTGDTTSFGSTTTDA